MSVTIIYVLFSLSTWGLIVKLQMVWSDLCNWVYEWIDNVCDWNIDHGRPECVNHRVADSLHELSNANLMWSYWGWDQICNWVLLLLGDGTQWAYVFHGALNVTCVVFSRIVFGMWLVYGWYTGKSFTMVTKSWRDEGRVTLQIFS